MKAKRIFLADCIGIVGVDVSGVVIVVRAFPSYRGKTPAIEGKGFIFRHVIRIVSKAVSSVVIMIRTSAGLGDAGLGAGDAGCPRGDKQCTNQPLGMAALATASFPSSTSLGGTGAMRVSRKRQAAGAHPRPADDESDRVSDVESHPHEGYAIPHARASARATAPTPTSRRTGAGA